MINKKAQLDPDIFHSEKLLHESTRDGFGRALLVAGENDNRVVALCADLAESTRMHWFKERFPDRYIELGVAEQNLATVASGMAQYGKIPFMASYATFSPGRNNEQIRTTISINNVPVKIVGSHAGVSVGPDGATHQALEDIGLMRMQPNMVVLVPCDSTEARKVTLASIVHDGPVYMRLSRADSPVFTTENTPFEIGKAQILYESEKPDVTIIATGSLVYNALSAAYQLDRKVSCTVINLSTIKPLDSETILFHVRKSGAVVTVEEHQIAGGMGSTVAELLARELPTPQEFIGVHDRFGQSGTPDELIREYGMDVESIITAIHTVVGRKGK